MKNSKNSSFAPYHFRTLNYALLILYRHSRKPWTKFINSENQHLAVPEVQHLTFLYTIMKPSC